MLRMASPHFYTNGDQRWGDNYPNQADKSGDDGYQWWYGQFGNAEVSENLDSPHWDSDVHAIIARRELFRSMGGKPKTFTPQQMAQWKRDAAAFVYFLAKDPCGAFCSKPKQEPENFRALAAFANWYWFLAPSARWELLQDIQSGQCDRWMPVVLAMRAKTPAATRDDPTYQGGDMFRVQQTGDDPDYYLTGQPGVVTSDWGKNYENPCANPTPGVATPLLCFQDQYVSPWPILWPSGQPVAIPGFPAPCQPFPECVIASLPPGLPAPCMPWPRCAFDAAAALAGMTPGAQVMRTSAGNMYVPAASLQDTAASAAKSSSTPYIIAGLLGVAGIVLVGLAASSK
jgi:hypothetical protein